jgi:hypothetical protein
VLATWQRQSSGHEGWLGRTDGRRPSVNLVLGAVLLVQLHTGVALGGVPDDRTSRAGRPPRQNPFVKISPADAGSFEVTVDGEPFATYFHGPQLMRPTLAEIHSPAGSLITRGFPWFARPGERTDHEHHFGLWFSYGDVDSNDFWNNPRPPESSARGPLGRIKHVKIERHSSGRGHGHLLATSLWLNPQGDTVLRETTEFHFWAARERWAVDRTTVLDSHGKIATFGDSKEGLLGMRLARALEHASESQPKVSARVQQVPGEGPCGQYRTSAGDRDRSVWGKRAKWLALAGRLAGQPVTIAVLDHPKNEGYPTRWHARGYGLLAANPIAAKAFDPTLSPTSFLIRPEEPRRFIHRVLIYAYNATDEQIEQDHTAFVSGRF